MDFLKSLFFGSPDKGDSAKNDGSEGRAEISAPQQSSLYDDSAADLSPIQEAIKRLVTAEDNEYQTALARLASLSGTAFIGKTRDFDGVTQYLRNAHEKVSRMFALCQGEVKKASSSRLSSFSELTKAAIISPGLVAPCYSYFLDNVMQQVAQGIPAWQEPLFNDYEDFLNQLRNITRMQSTPKKLPSAEPAIKKRQKTASEPTPVARGQTLMLAPSMQVLKCSAATIPKAAKPPAKPVGASIPRQRKAENPKHACEICETKLKKSNYCPVPDHNTCFVCVTCIRTMNNIKLLCPVCKLGYIKQSKELLEEKSPGLLESLKANRNNNNTKKKVESSDSSDSDPNCCDTCHEDCTVMDDYHVCVGGKRRCIDCEKRLIVRSCYRKKLLCPQCHRDPPELFYERLKCSSCQRLAALNQISHWCLRNKSYAVCENCEPRCGCSTSR